MNKKFDYFTIYLLYKGNNDVLPPFKFDWLVLKLYTKLKKVKKTVESFGHVECAKMSSNLVVCHVEC